MVLTLAVLAVVAFAARSWFSTPAAPPPEKAATPVEPPAPVKRSHKKKRS